MKKPIKRPEQDIQKAVVRHLISRGKSGIYYFHPANGGYRKPIEAAILYALGVRAGVPDLFILKDGKCYCLELKAPTGRISPQQGQAMKDLANAGATVGMAFSLDEDLAWLERYEILRPNKNK